MSENKVYSNVLFIYRTVPVWVTYAVVLYHLNLEWALELCKRARTAKS